MCSKRCAKPVRPGVSFFEPTWYQTLTPTMGVEWSSWKMTRSPFGRKNCVYLIGGRTGADFAAAAPPPPPPLPFCAGARRVGGENTAAGGADTYGDRKRTRL